MHLGRLLGTIGVNFWSTVVTGSQAAPTVALPDALPRSSAR
jgi:hypothetical protein